MDGRKQDGDRVVRRRIDSDLRSSPRAGLIPIVLRENSTASACLPILDRGDHLDYSMTRPPVAVADTPSLCHGEDRT